MASLSMSRWFAQPSWIPGLQTGFSLYHDYVTLSDNINHSELISTVQKMEELGKSSDQIGRIIAVIDDIADQTNLLALNAAIEAARAGEQGRGFAVVADEVRKLAERTTTATKEIAQMIKSIQDEIKSALKAMEEGTAHVEDGVQSTVQAGDSLREIIHTAERVGEMVAHIATAGTQQSATAEHVKKSMQQIALLVKATASAAQGSATACQGLSELAVDLQQMVGNFQLRTGNRSGRRDSHEENTPEYQPGDGAIPLPALAPSPLQLRNANTPAQSISTSSP